MYVYISFPHSHSHHQTDTKPHSVLINTPKVAVDVSTKTCTASLFYAGLFYGSPPACWMRNPTRVTALKFSLNKSNSEVQASFSLSIPPASQQSWTKTEFPQGRKESWYVCMSFCTESSPSPAMPHHTFLHHCSLPGTMWGQDLYKAAKVNNHLGSLDQKIGGNATWQFWNKISRIAMASWSPQSPIEMWKKVKVPSSTTSHNGFTDKAPHLQCPILCFNPCFSIKSSLES